jgi:pyruvate dehydrogenase E2 component (dihydrolipoamide acetyltransferase)
MARSKREIPHYYLSTQVDLSRALEWLRKHNEPLKPGERILPLVLLLKAVALAARKVPEVNGFYDAGEFRPAAGVHVGVAISLREGGLVVPALHDVDEKPLDRIGSELTDLIERARRGQLRSSELADATLTVTSLGERGVEQVFGVIFPPQVALVGFGKIADSCVVVDGECLARPCTTATLAADHRVSDGHRGGLFLAEVDSLLQAVEAL